MQRVIFIQHNSINIVDNSHSDDQHQKDAHKAGSNTPAPKAQAADQSDSKAGHSGDEDQWSESDLMPDIREAFQANAGTEEYGGGYAGNSLENEREDDNVQNATGNQGSSASAMDINTQSQNDSDGDSQEIEPDTSNAV